MPSLHMNAPDGAFAETVIMPGDPLRAKYIAERFLDDAKQVTDVRNMLGFTGSYQGEPLSVMAHGMGTPSALIYCTELVQHYGVKRMLRVGSCGAVHPDVQLRDIIIAQGASTDSAAMKQRLGPFDFAATASYRLLEKAVNSARALGTQHRIGSIFTSDLFYWPEGDIYDRLAKYNILAIEMEAAAVYSVAAEFGVEALAIATVSDHIRTGAALSTEERQTTFDQMIELGLATVSA
ncbi:purine-nucleoside phosphorylase [Pseudoteredinibacter isoporae]|uniref:purine-nucleoside phosphorylase n=1 Tax=Pseudoteredinibacter isoporae TaxID=570281 RepID=UPI003105CB43